MNTATLNQRQCSVEGCNNVFEAKGMCKMHYMRVWHTGSTDSIKPPPLKDVEAFSAYLQRNIKIDKNGCWLWQGAMDGKGYGVIGVNYKNQRAHRLSAYCFLNFKLTRLCVCHSCDVTACINPTHLFIGTQKDNITDMMRKNRGRFVKPDVRGEKHGNSRLKADDVRYIRKQYNGGSKSLAELSAEYQIGRQHVWDIAKGRRWSHLV